MDYRPYRCTASRKSLRDATAAAFAYPFWYCRAVFASDGIKPVIKAIRKGLPFYYLPDQDFGASDAVFVPFFGVSAATVTGLSRLSRVAGRKSSRSISRQLPGAGAIG